MPFVYILQSETTSRFYIGCTDDVATRVVEHNRGQTLSTRARGPWTLVHQEEFGTLAEARKRERQLKSWKSHRSIQQLIDQRRGWVRFRSPSPYVAAPGYHLDGADPTVQSEQFHRITKALADPRRYEVFRAIAGCNEMACSNLREHFPISAATLSHHIKELSTANLIDLRKEAKFMHIKVRRKVWKEYLRELSKL